MGKITVRGVKDAEQRTAVEAAVAAFRDANPGMGVNPSLALDVEGAKVTGHYAHNKGARTVTFAVSDIGGKSTNTPPPIRRSGMRAKLDRKRERKGLPPRGTTPIPPLFGFNSRGDKKAAAPAAPVVVMPLKEVTRHPRKSGAKKKGAKRKRGK